MMMTGFKENKKGEKYIKCIELHEWVTMMRNTNKFECM